MKISIVVPVYNRATLIAATMDALLAQTDRADEIIVVDDGSTDSTVEVLGRYSGAVSVYSVVNGGDLVARNIGLRASSGSLVAFCDSDDLWQPSYLARMRALFERVPGLHTAYSNFRVLAEGAVSPRTKFDDAPEGFWAGSRPVDETMVVFDAPIVGKLLAFQPFFPSCMTVDRDAFLALGGWDEGVSRLVGSDLATAMRVGASPPIGVLREALVSIRKHASNFSGDVEAMNLGDARVLEQVLKTRPELAPLADAIGRSVAARRRSALDSAFVRQDFGAVRDIDRLIPRQMRPLKHRIKAAVAALPPGLASLTAAALSRLSEGPERS